LDLSRKEGTKFKQCTRFGPPIRPAPRTTSSIGRSSGRFGTAKEENGAGNIAIAKSYHRQRRKATQPDRTQRASRGKTSSQTDISRLSDIAHNPTNKTETRTNAFQAELLATNHLTRATSLQSVTSVRRAGHTKVKRGNRLLNGGTQQSALLQSHWRTVFTTTSLPRPEKQREQSGSIRTELDLPTSRTERSTTNSYRNCRPLYEKAGGVPPNFVRNRPRGKPPRTRTWTPLNPTRRSGPPSLGRPRRRDKPTGNFRQDFPTQVTLHPRKSRYPAKPCFLSGQRYETEPTAALAAHAESPCVSRPAP